jgi:hypothetical protein
MLPFHLNLFKRKNDSFVTCDAQHPKGARLRLHGACITVVSRFILPNDGSDGQLNFNRRQHHFSQNGAKHMAFLHHRFGFLAGNPTPALPDALALPSVSCTITVFPLPIAPLKSDFPNMQGGTCIPGCAVTFVSMVLFRNIICSYSLKQGPIICDS